MKDEQAEDEERRPVPSIVVDPCLQTPSEPPLNSLSDEEAERAANAIRPSWAPSGPPAQPGTPSLQPRLEPLPAAPGPDLSDTVAEEVLLAGTRKRKRRGQLLVGLAAVAVTAMLVVPLLSNLSGPSAPASTPAPANKPAPGNESTTAIASPEVAAPAHTGQAQASPEEPPAEAPPPALQEPTAPPVMFRIRTVPQRAELLIDGEAVDNPFDGPVPGGRELVIEARARGFSPARMTAKSDRDRIIGVSLKREHKKR